MALKYLYAPSGVQAGTAYGVIPNSADADFSSFARSSAGSRVDENGFITDVEANVPRLDYTGGGCPSLLLEPQSTNLFQYSENFNQSYWQHNANVTTTNSSELAPSGRLNANLIEYDGSGYSFIRIYVGAPSTASTLSVFAKKGNWRYFGLRHFQNSGNDHTVFDFDTETFSNIASGQTASFEVFPNGWYKIKVTHPSPESSTVVGFAISNSSGSELNTTGGQAANVHLFGAQLENQSYATSYIPTFGAASTRSADVGGSTLDISSEFDSREGTFMFEGSFSDQNLKVSLNSSTTTFSNRISIRTMSDTQFRIDYFAGGVGNQAFFNVSSTKDNAKIAIKWISGSLVVYHNGTEVVDVTNIGDFSPNILNRISLSAADNTSNKFKGRAKQFRVYDEYLSNAEMVKLTTL